MTEFVIEKLPSEVLVYDQVKHRAHCLTTSAALVWELCDGGRNTDDARLALSEAGSDESLETILAQLAEAELVRASASPAMSRRQMIGATAVAAAAVVSIWSPSVSAAGSVCGTKNNPCCASPPAAKKCTAGNQFCVGNVCQK